MTTITAIDAVSSHQSARRLWWSAGVHAAILLLCLVISAIPPTPASALERTHVTLIAPTPAITRLPRLKKVAAKIAAVQPEVETAAVEFKPPPPREFISPTQKPVVPLRTSQVEIASLQPVEIAPALSLTAPASTRELPPPPIVVGKLSNAKSDAAPQPSTATARTAGFSNTNGIAPSQQSRATARTAGFSGSNASASIADPKIARTGGPGFQGAAIANAPAPRATAVNVPLTRSIEIIKKPQPVYTEEARALRLEGEVLLEVLFTAAAEVRVLRVTRGLGHGLDEAAIASASHIEFRPALHEGEPTDQTVTVHIRFQLAY